MQRLTRRSGTRRWALREERGASAVLFALLLVPVLGFAAVAVDVGALYAARARLQVAADAAALAVAQDCARGSCGDMLGTAQAMVAANTDADEATAAPPELSTDPFSVTVTGSTPQEHWFAPVIGFESTEVTATATVAWGAPERGTAVLPLTFSLCEWLQQTGGGLPSTEIVRTIHFTKSSATTGCTGPSNLIVPGGFAYLDTPPGDCEAASARNERSYSSTGNTPPSTCTPAYLRSWVGETVLLPIFDSSGDTGNNAWYHVFGYAAFHITGFHFGGQFNTDDRPCTGNQRCVSGYFTRFVALDDAFEYGQDAPQMGASILRLIR